MLQKVKKRLEQLGYNSTSATDDVALEFLIEKANNSIKGYCNIKKIPDEVINAEVDYIAAEFLRNLATKGTLPESFELRRISSITEGDTQVSYDNNDKTGSIEQLFDATDRALKLALQPFKRLRW